jgi:amino acid adenylation domain-containing protein
MLVSEADRKFWKARDRRVGPTNPFIEFQRVEIEQSICARFEEQVRKYPTNLAVKTKKYDWNYTVLNRVANHIARSILRLEEANQEQIALLLGHDAPMIAAILGALKAGKIYVPLDPAYPRERLSYIMEDSRSRTVVTNKRYEGLARELCGGAVTHINIDELDLESPIDDVGLKVSPAAVAYLLYTSGSTGKPKGVTQSHRNVLYHIRNYTNQLHISAVDRLALVASFSFDGAVMDSFGALLNGAALFPFEMRTGVLEDLAKFLAEQEITIFHSVPTLYRHLVRVARKAERFPNLRLIALGGEEVVKHDIQLLKQHFAPSCILVNGFGPTECTIALQNFIDGHTEIARNSVPMGYPVDEVEVFLVNEAGQQTVDYGEIAIRTAHVALGYWRQPELTRKVFLPDPEGGDRGIYRTGDLGLRLADGMIEFAGRKDFQVKVRGYRIELGEVEAALLEHPEVVEAVVQPQTGANGDLYLAAYLVVTTGKQSSAEVLRQFLRVKLPEHMVPTAYMFLENLPLTPSGKVNRRALPEPEFEKPEDIFVAPRTPVEQSLARIWCQILRLQNVSVRGNFFDLGGQSILAMQIASRARDLNLEITMANIFECPTIESLALYLLNRRAKEADPDQTKKMLARIESPSDASVDGQPNHSPRTAATARMSLYCPESSSEWFGRRECNLIILINEHFEMESFERIAGFVREFDPKIHTAVVRDSPGMKLDIPDGPTLTFSPAAIRSTAQIGRVLCGVPLSKSEEYAALGRAGIPVPKWVVVTEEERPDLSDFAEYVVRKPNYGGMGAEVRIVRKDRVKWKPITTQAVGTSSSMIVQQFIYTGRRPVSYRVNTLFGHVLYSTKSQASPDRAELSSVAYLTSALQRGFAISASLRDARNELNFDEEVIGLAEDAHAAFPNIPLLGFDIVREVPSGKLYVLEANAIGYVWNFHSRQAADYGFAFEDQFDGVRKAAYVLAEKTQEYAC